MAGSRQLDDLPRSHPLHDFGEPVGQELRHLELVFVKVEGQRISGRPKRSL
jgi:hypothetical protein